MNNDGLNLGNLVLVFQLEEDRWDSDITRPSDSGALAANPQAERAPLMHLMADRSKEKDSLHLNHDSIALYSSFLLRASRLAILL